MQDLWVYCVHLLGLWTISYSNPLLASQHAHFSLCDLSRLNRLRRKLIYSEFWFRCWYNFSIVRSDFHFTIVKCALYEWAAVKNLQTIFDFLFFVRSLCSKEESAFEKRLHDVEQHPTWQSVNGCKPFCCMQYNVWSASSSEWRDLNSNGSLSLLKAFSEDLHYKLQGIRIGTPILNSEHSSY